MSMNFDRSTWEKLDRILVIGIKQYQNLLYQVLYQYNITNLINYKENILLKMFVSWHNKENGKLLKYKN